MDFERKSERNEKKCEQYRLERKQRRAMRFRIPAPRFGRGVDIPIVPDGMELVKFYGEPALIPVKEDGESMYGKSNFTVRQADALNHLLQQRLAQLKPMELIESIYE